MKIAAIICEYNPFHNGHKLQIEELRKKVPDVFVIALMSGNFVQRGSFAVLPKYERAKAAVLCGADLVLELPFPYACGSAEYFAKGAIRSLKALKCVDYLCFGSECGDADHLRTIADNCVSEAFKKEAEIRLKNSKRGSSSYAETLSETYRELYGEELPDTPNDILAVEYLKAMRREGFYPETVVIKRQGDFSASKSREAYFCGDFDELKNCVPKETYEICKESYPISFELIEAYPLASLSSCKPKSLGKYAEVNEGLDSRICSCADKASSLEELYSMCATKKYTNSKIRRAILNCILHITENDLKSEPQYILMLAMKEKHGKIFKEICKNSKIKILTKAAHYKLCGQSVKKSFEKMLYAERIYDLAFRLSKNDSEKRLKSPYILK